MPDANKFAKLKEIGYHIAITCALCGHGCFVKGQDWGTCNMHHYEHLKHTGPARDVSIHRCGTCYHATPSSEATAMLGAHSKFLGEG